MSAGVPAVWLGFVDYVRRTGRKSKTFRRAIVGGSACPPRFASSLQEIGVKTVHAWGMTELSPLGAVWSESHGYSDKYADERKRIDAKQNRAVPGVDLKIVGPKGDELPRNDKSTGELMARGHWVVDRYFGTEISAIDDGWFPIGDIATIDADRYMHITDRSKDMIKSGGEWISSIDLENIAMLYPGIEEAACIACAHPKWDERPLLVAVISEGNQRRQRGERSAGAGLIRGQSVEVVHPRRRRVRYRPAAHGHGHGHGEGEGEGAETDIAAAFQPALRRCCCAHRMKFGNRDGFWAHYRRSSASDPEMYFTKIDYRILNVVLIDCRQFTGLSYPKKMPFSRSFRGRL